jgi:hypothetical protein
MPGLRHRRAGVCPLWGPLTPDRHPPRSCRHPEDPRAPSPLPLGAESRPRPTRVRRRRVLIRLARGRGGCSRACAARRYSCRFGRSAGRLTAAVCLACMLLTRPGSLDPGGSRSCAL